MLIIALHAVSSVRLLCYSPFILQMKKDDSEQGSELPLSAARPPRASSSPKRFNFYTGRAMNFCKPVCVLAPLLLEKMLRLGLISFKKNRFGSGTYRMRTVFTPQTCCFLLFLTRRSCFPRSERGGACFWQSGPLCGLSAFLFVLQIIFTREERRSAHRHC